MFPPGRDTSSWWRVFETMEALSEYSPASTFQENVRSFIDIHSFGGINGLVCLCLFPAELGQLSGVAAILRFPVPEPEEEGGSDDTDTDSS